jgi:hypothetical protein
MDHGPQVLLVADWTADPHAVVAAAAARMERGACSFGLLIPARLHGLDWMGDPGASVPCARRTLDTIEALAAAAGLPVVEANIGDPDVGAAVVDALERFHATELIVCAPGRSGPLDLAHRARRLTRLPVTRFPTSPGRR